MAGIDWKAITEARGLHLSDAELQKLSTAMDALENAAAGLSKGLTHEVEPVTTLGEEAVEAK